MGGGKQRGYWVICNEDMGPIPKGTPGIAMTDCLTEPGAIGVDCLLFWPNHKVLEGKKDGNVWCMGTFEKCKVLKGNPSKWPGGEKAMKSVEKLLDGIIKRGEHLLPVMALNRMMNDSKYFTPTLVGTQVFNMRNVVIDGKGDGAWTV
jgi:hypothetical protein